MKLISKRKIEKLTLIYAHIFENTVKISLIINIILDKGN